MQRTSMRFTTTVIFLATPFLAAQQPPAHKPTPKNFAHLQKLIKPQPKESLWRLIPWETNINLARRKAAQAGKPLLIWAGGGSPPLGGC